MGEREVPIELPGHLLRVLGARDLEVLRLAQRRDAFAMLGPDPLHSPTEQVGEEEAVHQHRLRPWDWLLVAGHEPGPGGAEEVARTRRRGSPAGGWDGSDRPGSRAG